MDCTDLAADIALAMSQAVTVAMDSMVWLVGIVLVVGLVCGYLSGLWLADRRGRDDA